jgi:hypothetical protein
MNLNLAIIRSCLGDRCRVRLLPDGQVLEAAIDRRPADRTRVRFGQLVALDLDGPAAIVWRWHRGRLLAWQPSALLAALPEGRIVWARIGCVEPAALRLAGDVWLTRLSSHWEVHDAVLEGTPAHPEALLEWLERAPLPVVA